MKVLLNLLCSTVWAASRRESLALVAELGISAEMLCKTYASDHLIALDCFDIYGAQPESRIYSYSTAQNLKLEFMVQENLETPIVTLDQGVSFLAGNLLHHFYVDSITGDVVHDTAQPKGALNYFVSNSISFFQAATKTSLQVLFNKNSAVGATLEFDRNSFEVAFGKFEAGFIKIVLCKAAGATQCRAYDLDTRTYRPSIQYETKNLTLSSSVGMLQLVGDYLIVQSG